MPKDGKADKEHKKVTKKGKGKKKGQDPLLEMIFSRRGRRRHRDDDDDLRDAE